ncbi:MAG: DEAD/DEAH box helicase family protein [Candidatus Dechloromonas phosphoritropha]|jgi:superfamily II DNA or RNA helicase
MILRPRQREFVTRCVGALKTHGNTLGAAPTGAGKTICLSGTAGEFLAHPDAKACVLAHRDELTAQNLSKFSRVAWRSPCNCKCSNLSIYPSR